MSRAWLPKLGFGVRDWYEGATGGGGGGDDELLFSGWSGGGPMLGGI